MKLKDNSSDKKYFTIVPNCILNYSSAIDQGLYIQMKRLVGDNEGVCYASEKYFKDKLKIGSKALKTSLKYLLEHGWIEGSGEREVNTRGGVQRIKTYLVKDIWKSNTEYYKGVSESNPLVGKGVSESNPLVGKGVSESNARGVQKEAKGGRFQATKKNILKKNNEEEAIAPAIAENIPKFIDFFKEVSPNAYKGFFGNLTERRATIELLALYSMPQFEFLITKILPQFHITPYTPKDCKAFKPTELLRNLDKIMAKVQELKGQNKNIIGVAI